MILTHVVACSENRVIGAQGDIPPWNLAEDMKFFRDTTKGHIMIMGRKTFESFKGKALPNRYHIVITREPAKQKFESTEKSPVVFVSSLEEAIELAKPLTAQWGDEVFIIGGGEIYKQALDKNLTDKIYLTLVHREFHGDTYYPQIDEKVFTLTNRRDVETPIPFSFLTYIRK
ncbi:dihydrofolate reductase [Bdellovibrio svalbardensis]|uniref:Dihydrofolate reductase n=1 Tax=Bdellovibrio svalbardensis TaxID=2972972 RepID=A0ABT6DF93_9BACT|nr:dihydrofolate reductase [Bdellovibrio svalbardensis]MDG0815520.1 dihydrofolate reductase [Bdellovibrio svalbardensis]